MLSLKKIATKVAAKDSSSFNFSHQHMTSLDFGINRPILCQEVIPHDEIKFNMSSFARLAPLALPTIGQANIEARAFFVRNRDICNQWEDFISNKSSFYTGQGNFIAPFPTFIRPVDLVRLFIVREEVMNVANFQGRASDFETTYGSLPQCLTDYTYSETANPDDYDVEFYMFANSTDMASRIRRRFFGNFTPYGKALYSFLQNLGYRLDFCLSAYGNPNTGQYNYLYSLYDQRVSREELRRFNDLSVMSISALPLLAAVKVFVDYYRNPRYNTAISSILFDNTLTFVANDSLLMAEPVETYLDLASNVFLNVDVEDNTVTAAFFIQHFGDIVYILQSPDIYTSSWTSMNSNGDVRQTSELQLDGLGGDFSVLSDANSVHMGSHTSRLADNNFVLTAIQKLASFVRRNNVVGNRYVDQILARFGVRPSDAVAGRSEYLGSWITPINISDVTATANGIANVDGETISSAVGDYNGKGVAFGNGKTIDFKSDEHGFFIVFATIRPLVQYYNGALDHIYRTSLFDYFTPEFDSMSMEAIGSVELYPEYSKSLQSFHKPDGSLVQDYITPANLQTPFGYLPTYSSYKYRRDSLSGDFRIFRYRNSLDSFHLMRPVYFGDLNNQAFQVFDDLMRAEYDRIFRDTSIDDEHFFCSFMFDLTMRRPMKSISESFVLDGDQGRDRVVTPPAGQRF